MEEYLKDIKYVCEYLSIDFEYRSGGYVNYFLGGKKIRIFQNYSRIPYSTELVEFTYFDADNFRSIKVFSLLDVLAI